MDHTPDLTDEQLDRLRGGDYYPPRDLTDFDRQQIDTVNRALDLLQSSAPRLTEAGMAAIKAQVRALIEQKDGTPS